MANKKKAGRPCSENPKDYMFRVRMDKNTVSKLDELCKKKGLSRSEIVRLLIEKAK